MSRSVGNDGAVTLRIEDYGLIGDTHTAALVGRDGSIDWLCLPRFDSAACFAHLLGESNHGFWRIAPVASPLPGQGEPLLATRRRYAGDTLVLETEFDLPEGSVRLSDCMPIRELSPTVVRRVECLSGSVDMRMDLEIRFEYGSVVPWVRRVDGQLVAIAGPDGLALWTPLRTRGEGMRTVSEFTLREGQQESFVLTYFSSHGDVARPVSAQYAIEETKRWWQDWADLANFEPHEWRDAVVRSLITLKALTYAPTGGIVAAPTTSLPESARRRAQLGLPLLLAARRDLHAVRPDGRGLPRRGGRLGATGCCARSRATRRSSRSCTASPARRNLTEDESRLASRLRRLEPGPDRQRRRRAVPARRLRRGARRAARGPPHWPRRPPGPAWDLELALLDFLETGWNEPDDGIWEVRGPRRHFTHSKVMAWVAVDRAVSDVEDFGLEGPRRPVAGPARRDPRRGVRQGLRRRSATPSLSTTARRSSTPAC